MDVAYRALSMPALMVSYHFISKCLISYYVQLQFLYTTLNILTFPFQYSYH